MFYNEVSSITFKNEILDPKHDLFDFSGTLNGSHLILIFFIAFNLLKQENTTVKNLC